MAHVHIANLGLAQAKASRSHEYAEIAAQLPDYVDRVVACMNLEPHAVTVLDSETNVTLRIETAGAAYTLKISPWQGDLYVSTYFFSRLATSALPVPRVVLYDDTRTVIPYEVQALAWIEGADLRDVPPSLHRQAGMLMGRALRTVHGIAVEGFGSPQPSGGWSTPSWRAALRQDHLFERRIVDAVFTPQESAAIEATTLGDPQLEIARPHLIHGDVGPVNGLFQVENGAVALAGIIDPGGTVGGDPMFDLAGGTNDRDAYARGIWEGYTEGYALTPAEEYRYRRLLLLSYYWTACWQYQTGRDFDERKAWALEALHAL